MRVAIFAMDALVPAVKQTNGGSCLHGGDRGRLGAVEQAHHRGQALVEETLFGYRGWSRWYVDHRFLSCHVADCISVYDGRSWERLPLSLCARLRRVEIHFAIRMLDVHDAPHDHPPMLDEDDDDAPLEDQVPSNLLFAVIRSIPPWVRTVDIKLDFEDSLWDEEQEDCAISRVNWLEIGQWVATRLEGVVLRMDVPQSLGIYMSTRLRTLENQSQLTVRTH